MSLNYYARVIPTKEEKEALKRLIDTNDFKGIKLQVFQMYDSFDPFSKEYKIQGEIHLGKKTDGWKFLWNPNIYQIRNGHTEWIECEDGSRSGHWVQEPDTPYYVYPLTKEGIKAFINREDVEIYDEEDEKQDKEDFIKMAFKVEKKLLDINSYFKEHPRERRFSSRNDYTQFLELLGYNLSEYKEEFYSDGLRFSASTDFR